MSDIYAELERATRLVAGAVKGPNCVEAAALTIEVGLRLGIELQARAVSMFAFSWSTGQSIATGFHGRAFGESYLRRLGDFGIAGEFEGGTPFQRYAGHMIVTSEDLQLLLDPTFAQFEVLGDAAVALYVSEIRAKGNGRFWEVGDGSFYARYFAADDFLDDGFGEVRAAMGPRADEIANFVHDRRP